MSGQLIRRRRGAVVIAVFVTCGGTAYTQEPFDEASVVSALANHSAEERTAAVGAIKKLPVAQRSESVVGALLQELERLRQQLEERQLALLTGQPLAPSADHGEYLFSVLDVVTQHKDDVSIIRPLLPFIGTGNRVVDTLAGFGELAVADVTAVAESGLATQLDVHSALLVLRRMLERPGNHPVGASSKAQIAKVATERLSGAQKDTVVMMAIDLAVASGDPQLLQRVQQLARDPAAVQKFGIGDAASNAAIQKRAYDAITRGKRP